MDKLVWISGSHQQPMSMSGPKRDQSVPLVRAQDAWAEAHAAGTLHSV
jgi:hypothetical protein